MSGDYLEQERRLLELSIVGLNQQLGLSSTTEARKSEIRGQRKQMISRLRTVIHALAEKPTEAKP